MQNQIEEFWHPNNHYCLSFIQFADLFLSETKLPSLIQISKYLNLNIERRYVGTTKMKLLQNFGLRGKNKLDFNANMEKWKTF